MPATRRARKAVACATLATIGAGLLAFSGASPASAHAKCTGDTHLHWSTGIPLVESWHLVSRTYVGGHVIVTMHTHKSRLDGSTYYKTDSIYC